MHKFWLSRTGVKIVVSGILFLTASICGHCEDGSSGNCSTNLIELGALCEANDGDLMFFRPVYFGETFSNARGGKSTQGATRYSALLNLEIGLDLEKSRLKLPGNLYILAQNTHGRGLTEDFIGDTQVISNIDSFRNITQVGQYWWESRWLDDDVTIRLGKQDLNTEFQNIGRAEHFIQSTFGLSPSTAFPTYPDQALGAVGLFQLRDSLQLKMGAWSAFAKGGSWGLSDTNSYLVIAELERSYTLVEDRLPGIFAVGALYESEGVLDGEYVSAVREYYFQWEQSLYSESPWDAESHQGLAAFTGYYPRFPGEQPIAKSIGDSAVGGFTYTGLFPSRDNDVMGIGLAWSELFQGGTNQETATELFYKAVWTQRLSIQPDLQYITSPSGIFRDALAIGIRFEFRP
jgi:porin